MASCVADPHQGGHRRPGPPRRAVRRRERPHRDPVARRSEQRHRAAQHGSPRRGERPAPRPRRHPGRRAHRAADCGTRWCGAPRTAARGARHGRRHRRRMPAPRRRPNRLPRRVPRGSGRRRKARSTSIRTRRSIPRCSVCATSPAWCRRSGFPYGATASHCVSLGMQDEYTSTPSPPKSPRRASRS